VADPEWVSTGSHRIPHRIPMVNWPCGWGGAVAVAKPVAFGYDSLPKMSSTPQMQQVEDPRKATGIGRIVRALGYSLEGLGSCLKHEAAFRQELAGFLVLAPLALILPVPPLVKVALLASLFLVLIVELLNSAVEWVVDLASRERHPFAKRAKDMGSAAVLLSLTLCGLTWVLLLSAHAAELRDWAGF